MKKSMFGKRNILISTGLIAVMALSGCGAKTPADSPVSETAIEQQEVTQKAATEEASAAEEVAAESPAEETTTQEENTDATQIYGNGSYFVKVGDKVFFHNYENAVATEPSQGGQFLWLPGGLECFDETSGTLTQISDEPTFGELYLCGDQFYCTQEDAEGGLQIIRISMDGEVFRVGPGSVEGASKDGKLVALWCNDASGKHLDVLDAQNLQYCRVDQPDNGSIYYCGLSTNGVVYQKKVADETKLYCMGYGSNEVCLGTLSGLGIYGTLECDDFICDAENDDIYCLFAQYGGPVDMVEDYMVVKANAGEADSLSLLQHGYDNEKMPTISNSNEPSIRLNDGEISYGFFDEDKLYLSHSYLGSHMLGRFVYGNLLWCDGEGNVNNIIKNFIPYMDRDALVMQTGQVLGDEAYVLIAGVIRDMASDYKLSQAFDFSSMYVLRIPLKEDSSYEVIQGGDFDGNITFDAEGFEPYVGTWRLDKFVTVDEAEPRHSANMWLNIAEDQELRFIDYEEYNGYPFMLSTAPIGNECLIVGYSEGLELTMTGKLVVNEVDGSENLLLEVQEKNESIDDIRPASWQGSFHRVTEEEWKAEWG